MFAVGFFVEAISDEDVIFEEDDEALGVEELDVSRGGVDCVCVVARVIREVVVSRAVVVADVVVGSAVVVLAGVVGTDVDMVVVRVDVGSCVVVAGSGVIVSAE